MITERPLLRRRWDKFTNASGETIPAWACMRMVQTTDGLEAYQPNDDVEQVFMFNGPMPVADESEGLATFDEPMEALFDTDDGTPEAGQIWGPVDGSWKLGIDGAGFAALGPTADTRAYFLANENNADTFPAIVRIVTNDCLVDEGGSLQWDAGEDTEIADEAGEPIVLAEFTPKQVPFTTKVKCTVLWSDVGFEAASGDTFSFSLFVNTEEYTGAPKLFVGTLGFEGTSTEMTWEVTFLSTEVHLLALKAFRVDGFHPLTAMAASRIEIDGDASGNVVEYRHLIVPGARLGPKICVRNPKDCCIEDQSSDTSSQDTASRSPFPLYYSPGNSLTCIDLMGWHGKDEEGFIMGAGPVAIAKRFKVTLPTFSQYSLLTALPSYPGITFQGADQGLIDAISGREVIVETFPTGEFPSWLIPTENGFWIPLADDPFPPSPEYPFNGSICGYYGEFQIDFYDPYLEQNTNFLVAVRIHVVFQWVAPAGMEALIPPRKKVVLSIYAGPSAPFGEASTVSGSTIYQGVTDFQNFYFDSSLTFTEVARIGFLPATEVATPRKVGVRGSGGATAEPY